MDVVCLSKRSSVFYDKKRDAFIKTFNPNIKSKIKYFFRLRKYPGYNFNYIRNVLKNMGFNVVTILEYSKYSITTENIHGISLEEYYFSNPEIIKDYINLVVKLLNNGIYAGDLSLDNFIVKDNKIYIIDMEDYRYTPFILRGKKEALRRLKLKIPYDIFIEIESKINAKS